ncbi:hypothetical protein SteCoe_13033 [Stentor coeruleus]|uniref:CCT domain-containing protein n=1 Tax=Stentor coeruleus TaxID=5963 RepID=A0A1R2C9D6_9CILI|nr:hypothetical protein SteCoe_13033 [Stentor coeruleus]
MLRLMGMPEIVAPEEVADVHIASILIMREREKRQKLINEMNFQRQKNLELEKFIQQLIITLKMTREIEEIEKSESDFVKIGAYSKRERAIKIKKYKLKLKKRRAFIRVSRNYKGRSLASKAKSRVRGRFAKVNQML